MSQFKKGAYYIGDLCYVLADRWDEVCDLIIDGHNCLDGQFNLKDGARFAIYSTAYGDGCYNDQSGREYCVDAGSIGCISLEHLDTDTIASIGERKLGAIVEFTEGFNTGFLPGNLSGFSGQRPSVIFFGDVVIDTDPPYEERYEEEEEEEEGVF